ncbi:MAG: type II toxin-antitoxin system RelE/ParE family toxin [bacterium]
MATWRIEWKASAAKELRSLDRQLIPRLLAAISNLSSNPFPAGFKKLHGSEHTYRLRVNDYRITDVPGSDNRQLHLPSEPRTSVTGQTKRFE